MSLIGNKQLSDFKYYMDYSKYREDLGRKETWEESVDRIMDMHRIKYKDVMSPELSELMDYAEYHYKEKNVLGSMRALQFGGEPILNHNSKLYNCLTSYCDRVEFFQEAMYWLLSGCGVGFSVQKPHISKLPSISIRDKGVKTFTIEDSIEGWADAIGVLISSYVKTGATFPEYQGYRVDFDTSLIRPKGAHISGGFKAPGPDGLRQTLYRIQDLLDSQLNGGAVKIKPIVAYDVVMHVSDAVLSGGIRRAATLALFSIDDEEMMSAKTGNWFTENPQRARSNNTAVLIRDEITKEEFDSIFDKVKQFGEPGFGFSSSVDILYNPLDKIAA